ncbi:MAG TPA: glycosyltransferase, partial [Candidatus Kryptonia bacterium]|nr:glycosyltransferase [Candidatus Kryptonia bacterium]
MRISGFSFVRNAVELYYPVVESIRSILPICDEFVIAAGDSTDGTTELLRTIDDPKLKIIETVWDQSLFKRGAINAQQTNLALDACRGDWCFYLQADEVMHEQELPVLVERMRTYLDDRRVEGLLFEYRHFFADYDHYHTGHAWYRREVRIVRNGIGARSWKSAQGFRNRAGEKLHVAHAGASVFHYGWVRPPRLMTRRRKAFLTI